MLLLKIDRSSDVPAYQQVCDQIAAQAETGALQPGDRLPSTRSLAISIGLHRSSVVRAYAELRALGYLEGRPGSYSTIRRGHRLPTTRLDGTVRSTGSLIAWEAIAKPSTCSLRDHAAADTQGHSKVIDLDRLCADPSLAPEAALRRCLKTELLRTGGAALDYAETSGWLPLKKVLAKRMCNHGVMISVDEILITAGAQQALDLVLRYLTSPDDRVVVEAPTYGMAHSLFKLHEVQPVEIPLLEDGMDLDTLQQVLQKGQVRPKLIFTMPNFHNPTGITTGQQHRERLLALCEEHRVPLLEDGFEEEMKYFGQAVLPVKSMDSRGIVIYVGTFSKVVFPGLRVGWICAPHAAISRLTDIKYASCITGNTLAQAVAARFCVGGEFEAYLRRIHRVYRRRMQTLLRALKRHMPNGVHWTRPTGGFLVWLTLRNCSLPEEGLLERILYAGVKVGPGRRYFAGQPEALHLRLSIACVDEDEIETACRLLGHVLGSEVSNRNARDF